MSSPISFKDHPLSNIPKNGINIARGQKWTVQLTRDAYKQFRKLPLSIQELTDEAITDLKNFGYMPKYWDVKKLGEKSYRLRLNYRYRLKYTVKNDLLLIEIFYIGHRKNAY